MFPEKIELHMIEGAHHNDLPSYPEFYELLYEILYIQPKKE
jgi:hypothetical protein